ncbi:hypothetical protein CYMTET_43120 [Cymbomonas tetramitiformis]|uniref:EamA domain-containing protein n=1 Tax=Cymbomonas tetramitiformis TaxID=36881 RepID=A0AAE0C450_9CHLO|nr:hypothetical protein CYMTET_43120 [Cymbomonas tetramitiformis]
MDTQIPTTQFIVNTQSTSVEERAQVPPVQEHLASESSKAHDVELLKDISENEDRLLAELSSEGAEQYSGSFRSLALLNVAACLFGSTSVVLKTVEESSPLPFSYITAIRFLIAAACFAPALYKKKLSAEKIRAGGELGLWLFFGYIAQAIGLETTSAARGAFTLAFTVLVVPLLVGFEGRKVPTSNYIGAIVALCGVGLLTTSGEAFSGGDAWCIAAAALFGVHKWRAENYTRRINDTSQLTAMQLVVLAMASGSLALGDYSLHALQGVEYPSLSALETLPWPELLYMGCGTTAFTLWLEVEALKDVSVPLAALIYTTEPLWGAAFAWVLLGDRWGAQGWVGAALIIGSSLGSQLVGDKVESKDNYITCNVEYSIDQGSIDHSSIDQGSIDHSSIDKGSIDHSS